MEKQMTDAERASLVALLLKAIQCEQLIVHVPASMTKDGFASVDCVVSLSQNGPALQLNLE